MSRKSIFTDNNNTRLSSQRFFLYVKLREINEVNNALNKTLKMPVHEQKRWADENGIILDTALNAFIEDTNIILEKISLDDEVLDLSEKLVVGLKNVVQNIDKLLEPFDELKS